MTALEVAMVYIQDKLEAGSLSVPAGNIFADLAPQGTEGHYVTYQFIPGGLRSEFGTDRATALEEVVLLVKATVQGLDNLAAVQLSGEIKDTLHLPTTPEITDDEDYTVQSYFIDEFYMPISENGKRYVQAGGRYCVLVRPAL